MGSTSEREYLEKISKIKANAHKKAADAKNDFAKIQKLKAEALKKTEEMMQSTEKNLSKIERGILKNKDLAAESIDRLNDSLKGAKKEIEEKYDDLKKQVSQAINQK